MIETLGNQHADDGRRHLAKSLELLPILRAEPDRNEPLAVICKPGDLASGGVRPDRVTCAHWLPESATAAGSDLRARKPH